MTTFDPTDFDLQYREPAQRFREFQSQVPQAYQRAFQDRFRPLWSRYQLQQPTYAGDFGQFLASYGGNVPTDAPGYTQMGTEAIRDRARAIAGLTSIQTPAAFQQFLTQPGGAAFEQTPYLEQTRGLSPAQMAAYREMYGGAESGENVQSLVNLMLGQRPGGGQYGGYMQNAIGQMVNQLYNAYMAQNEANVPAGFLNWYLDRPTEGGFAAAPAATVA